MTETPGSTKSRRRWSGLSRVSALLTSLCTAVLLPAQERSLDWPEVAVVAHVDADGRLIVRERQTMRFSGDWNGGERTFLVRFGQRFRLDSMARLESPIGPPLPMVRGNVDVVDGYDVFDGHVVRWRSRLPDDPPFLDRTLHYVLHVQYSDVLQPTGDTAYTLSHDFAFSDRASDIARFSLTLTIDSAWRAPADFTGQYTADRLPPGQGFVVTVPLTRVSATPPAGVRIGASSGVRQGLVALLIAGLVVIFVRLFRHDAQRGRFTAGPPRSIVTPQWLEQELLVYLPEVVGAAWDGVTAQQEVAATLARLVQEGKLRSRVETEKVLIFERHVLHLELTSKRASLRAHERALIDALFDSHSNTTSTSRVRERYRKSGFDPASTIRSGLDALVSQMMPEPAATTRRRSFLVTLAMILAALAMVIVGVRRYAFDVALVAIVVAVSIVGYVITRAAAAMWRQRAIGFSASGVVMLVVLTVMTTAFSTRVVLATEYRTDAFTLAGLTLWLLALMNSVGNGARSVLSAERTAKRKVLATARDFFRDELRKPAPQLQDAWYPYMLAFGLGSHVDKWFKAFGGAAATGATLHSASVMGSGTSNSSGSGSSFTGFGGGGGFSGGGGGASFGAAIGSMASSVPSPSSSSSGGGSSSSGGSSSGGGGGGGW